LSPGRLDRVRASLKPRPRRPASPAAAPPQPTVQPVASPASADLEARRARLSREYEELQSDLGGLVYEMAIRDSYRLDVITRRAAKLQAVDAQLTEVERSLTALAQPAAASPPPPAPPPTPAAPAPAATAANSASATAPTAVVAPATAACPSCARPIEPGAAFCGACGAQLGSASPPAGAPSR
jgi:hypothetical protein